MDNMPLEEGFQTNEITPSHSDEVDYTIEGADLQYVEIILDPNESIVAEPGAMMFMESGIQMETKFSDGSIQNKGVWGSIKGAFQRSWAGEKMFLPFFTNKGSGRHHVAFAAPHPGMIVPLDLGLYGGAVLCQKGSFLCGAKGTSIKIGFHKRIGVGLFGGHGFIMQKIEGDGMAFIHAGGTVLTRDLEANETIYVDTGSVLAHAHSVHFDIKVITGASNMMFGGEDLFLSTLTGPGRIWIQSMPYKRLAYVINQTLLEMNKKRMKKENKRIQAKINARK